jgi:hypothetical protein
MGREIEKLLGDVDQSRRDFLRNVIAGAAFAPPLIASFSLDGLSLTTADAQTRVCLVSNATVAVSNATAFSYHDNFRDTLRGADINAGVDLAGGNHPALNFTGSANTAGGTWMTVLDTDPSTPDEDSPFEFRLGLHLSADVLIHRFNNTKGVGLLAGFNEQPGARGLALILWDAGNSDVLQLFTVDPAGKLTSLKGLGLGSAIAENAWYRLELDILPVLELDILPVGGGRFEITGTVSKHLTPADPDSDIQAQVAQLIFSGPLPAGVDARSGEVGIIARAISAAVDSSVTNFVVEGCETPVDIIKKIP